MLEKQDALEEYKRVDHLIHVTLKYTRTVDIIRNAIKRLVSTIDIQVFDIMEWAAMKKKIDAVPPVPLMRCNQMEKVFKNDSTVKDIVDFYHQLRKISLSEFKKKEEYRKNVALVTPDVEVTIDKLKDYANETKRYIHYLRGLMEQ
ncbi:hypothetical protein HY501_01215 [Candidatus Woesearchaeota archaeon]|nr:hypothetical protein [Candidatus Woesearchaeota archaeon]